MKKLIFFWFLIAISTINADEMQQAPVLILNSENIPNQIPRNFRIVQRKEWPLCFPLPFSARVGLDKLKASGSAQFSADSLGVMLQRIPSKKIVIVDLRQESHGFANGKAISWYGPQNAANIHKTLSEIEKDEEYRLLGLKNLNEVVIHRLLNKTKATIDKTCSIPMRVEQTSTEQKLVEDSGVRYVRIPVRDHYPPTSERVEQFFALIHSLDDSTWLHFHCSAGRGRTTTFLAMYDMVHNAHALTFEEILRRQHLLGGKDLSKTADNNALKDQSALERKCFLKGFYELCRSRYKNL